MWLAAAICLVLVSAWCASAPISEADDDGNTVELSRPATRVVSLAPHVTELIFAAGAGRALVGASAYSDYPPAAVHLPLVGDSRAIDLERVMALSPDLVVAWRSGNSPRQLAALRQLGVPVFSTEPRKLDDVPRLIKQLGRLFGTDAVARRAATQFRGSAAVLAQKSKGKRSVSVFLQIWDRPLTTVNRDHMINEVLALCGGENIFAKLTLLTPTVGVEAVLERDPEVILLAAMPDMAASWLSFWQRWPSLRVARYKRLYVINPDLIARQGPRLVQGADEVCDLLEMARGRQ
jgi:iron complex transport system substrate-binding protein